MTPRGKALRNGRWRIICAGASACAGVMLAAACSTTPTMRGPPATLGYVEGLTLLGDGDLPGAEQAFRAAASRCESGPQGRRALLFLAFLHQDPRYPEARPDTSAVMAIRALLAPEVTREERLQAEALYVSALDKGANPGLRPDPADTGFASRFARCEEPVPTDRALVLPVLESPSSIAERELRTKNGELSTRNAELTAEKGVLSAEIAALQAELDRIRTLLKPDTGVVRVPRRR